MGDASAERMSVKRKVYLAGPINGCNDQEANNWREQLRSMLPSGLFTVLNPMRRDYRGSELVSYREIVELDKRDITSSDFVLVFCTKPSVGTSMEILFAWERGIPVLTIAANGHLSPWLIYHSTAIVNGFEEAVETLKKWSDG